MACVSGAGLLFPFGGVHNQVVHISTTTLVNILLATVLIVGIALHQLAVERPPLRLQETELEATFLLQDLEIPWDMDWSPDGWIWFSEKRGRISRVSPDSGAVQEIHNIEDVYQSADNSGLHALALHPDFPEVPHVFVHYTYSENGSRLVRFTYDPSHHALNGRLVLLDEILASVTHNGSRIVFSPDGEQLFLSLGDAYRPELAQDLGQYPGKILRLNLDGSIPDDNPFPDSPVWSYGHRNPQGLVMASNGRLYSSEHGGASNDELNIIEKGRNYGHPDVRGFCDLEREMEICRRQNVTEPLMVWSPTYAVSGIEFYDHDAIPEWKGSILVTSLKKTGAGQEGQRLQQLRLSEDGDTVLEVNDYFVHTFGRLREVMMAPDGRVFLFTSNRERNDNRPWLVREGDDKLIMLHDPENQAVQSSAR